MIRQGFYAALANALGKGNGVAVQPVVVVKPPEGFTKGS